MATNRDHADASKPTIKVNKRRGPRATLTGRQSEFIDEYMANGQNASAAYRKAYRAKSSSLQCSQSAFMLLRHPVVAQAIQRKLKMLELARQNRLEAQRATEERIIDVLSTLAFFDPREFIQWDANGKGGKARVTVTRSTDLPIEAVFAIREILVMADGGMRFKFADRRAALMDLARIHGMVTDKSASFHFHEDLARMSPEDQKKRVAELLEFAANLKVSGGDDVIDVTPEEEEADDGA
jgi:hypothetical protein